MANYDAGKLDWRLPFLSRRFSSKSKLGPDHPDTLASMGNSRSLLGSRTD